MTRVSHTRRLDRSRQGRLLVDGAYIRAWPGAFGGEAGTGEVARPTKVRRLTCRRSTESASPFAAQPRPATADAPGHPRSARCETTPRSHRPAAPPPDDRPPRREPPPPAHAPRSKAP